MNIEGLKKEISTAVSSHRLKIDFIGIGAPKCGTTWVYECLKKHPDVCVSLPKEVHYFNEMDFMDWSKPNAAHKRPIAWYERSYAHCKINSVKGEFSTAYLYSKDAPGLIKSHYRDAKLILCLRNPVDRAYSHYWMNKKEQRRISESFEDVIANKNSIQIQRGFYAKYLRHYLKYFSLDDIIIVLMDDIKNQPVQTVERLVKGLGLDPSHATQMIVRPKNVAKESKSILLSRSISVLYKMLRALHLDFIILFAHNIGIKKLYTKINFKPSENPPMNPETRKQLIDHYKEDIRDLEKIIGRDLSHWMR